jgi:glucuronoarabinoxylan endo-1,4-beta-xylanase
MKKLPVMQFTLATIGRLTVRKIWVHSVILSSALLVWGCNNNGGGSSGTGGAPGTGGKSSQSGGSGGTSSGTGGTSSGTGGSAPQGTGGSSKGGAAGGGASDSGGAAGGGAAGNSAGAGGGGLAGKTGGDGGAAGGNTGGKGGGGGTGTTVGAGGSAPIDGGAAGAGGGGSGIAVQLDKTHQTIQGFGINDTWAEKAVPSAAFSTTAADGIGLTILRIGMSDQGSDYTGSIFSSDIASVKAANGKVIGSTWSPPANCKDSGTVNDGGHLKSSCYESWSDTIVKWAKGKGLYAMSIGNEGDFASCGMTEPCNGNYPTTVFTAKEFVAWVKVAGPKLQAAGIKVIGPEASEWIHTWSNLSATGSDPGKKNSSDPLKCGCFGNTPEASTAGCASKCTTGDGYDYGHWLYKDADAWKAFDILGVHEYDTQQAYPWPADVNDGKPDHEIWQTEMSGVKWWPEQGASSDIKNGIAVAGWVHSALVVGQASAWLWWWYAPLSSGTNDNEGLVLQGSTAWTKRYYTIGNYSKFVRPGFVMVDVSGNSNADVLLSAFKNTDGTVVVVAINKGSAAATVPITISGGTAPASCTPNVTSSSDNLKAGTAVTVTGGVLSASLASQTVTTYVCK